MLTRDSVIIEENSLYMAKGNEIMMWNYHTRAMRDFFFHFICLGFTFHQIFHLTIILKINKKSRFVSTWLWIKLSQIPPKTINWHTNTRNKKDTGTEQSVDRRLHHAMQLSNTNYNNNEGWTGIENLIKKLANEGFGKNIN